MDTLLQEKKEKLYAILRDMGGCVVGFSGGVDSTLLFAVAAEVLGDRALAVTATSETYPERELREAEAFARRIGGRHRVVVQVQGTASRRPAAAGRARRVLPAASGRSRQPGLSTPT